MEHFLTCQIVHVIGTQVRLGTSLLWSKSLESKNNWCLFTMRHFFTNTNVIELIFIKSMLEFLRINSNFFRTLYYNCYLLWYLTIGLSTSTEIQIFFSYLNVNCYQQNNHLFVCWGNRSNHLNIDTKVFSFLVIPFFATSIFATMATLSPSFVDAGQYKYVK